MNQDYQVEDLRERAERILAMRTQEKKKLTYSEVYSIIYDLNLHQVELDLQNQSLREAMLEIEQSRNKFVDLYNFIPLGYFTLNESGLILEANQAGADLIGVNKHRLLNQVLLRYIAPSFQYIYVEHCKDALSTMTMQSCEVKFLSKNGGLFYVQIDTKPIISSISGEKYLLTSLTDINERKLKEESAHQNQHQIATADRNMSLEKLGAVIAHELNQPLAITANYLHGCINRLESGVFQVDDIIGGLKKATEQYHRVAEIILRMKDFSCRGILQYEALNINQLVNQTMDLIKYEALYFPVSIKYMLANNVPLVKIDRIHIQQVILNLVRNAVEALRDSDVRDRKSVV